MTTESKTLALLAQLGWQYKEAGDSNVAVRVCPYCYNDHYKFFMGIVGDKDGLHDCKVCGKQGNLTTLKQATGISTKGVTSLKDATEAKTAPSPLPDYQRLHRNLLDNEQFADVLDYLLVERGFSLATIEALKLGAESFNGKTWYFIPYFDSAGNYVFYKSRTVPPQEKDFRGPSGRIAPLYNEAVLQPGVSEIVMCEGEADCISLLNAGYPYALGIPGSTSKKAEWITKLDAVKPPAIYLCYDLDKAGQTGAKEMATRIGIDLVYNIVLPQFNKADGTPGKDLNEWFAAGHTLEEFKELKANAKKYDVEGVQGAVELLEELKNSVQHGGLKPKYTTQYPDLNAKVGGFEDGDVVGIIAEGKVGKTTLALNMLEHWAKQGHNVLMYCDEMRPVRMVRKWVALSTLTDDDKIDNNTISTAMQHAAESPGDMLFAHTMNGTVDKVCDTIRQTVRRYGVKVVCYDNLQLLVRNVEHSSQETSVISKKIKQLAMELNVLILLIVQPHRVQEGHIVSARNSAGSAAIEKDVDFMICCHRNRVAAALKSTDFNGVMDTDTNFEPQFLIRVDLARYAPGGMCTLWMDGAKSLVRPFSVEDGPKQTATPDFIPI